MFILKMSYGMFTDEGNFKIAQLVKSIKDKGVKIPWQLVIHKIDKISSNNKYKEASDTAVRENVAAYIEKYIDDDPEINRKIVKILNSKKRSTKRVSKKRSTKRVSNKRSIKRSLKKRSIKRSSKKFSKKRSIKIGGSKKRVSSKRNLAHKRPWKISYKGTDGSRKVKIYKNGALKDKALKKLINRKIYGINNLTDRQIIYYKNKGKL